LKLIQVNMKNHRLISTVWHTTLRGILFVYRFD